jgi:hypothetical protein
LALNTVASDLDGLPIRVYKPERIGVMSRIVSICCATVYVVLAFQPMSSLAADGSERSTGNKKYALRDHRDTSSSPAGTKVTNTPVVRDHRKAPVVRDHRTTPVVRDHRATPVIRDHRSPAKVVDPHAKTRRPGQTPPIVRPIDPGRGDGKVVVRDHREPPIVRDHRDVPVIRDHRDTSGNPGGTKVTNSPIVRDHRDAPIIRDHRNPRVVRDHRTPVNVVDPFAKTPRPGKAPPVVRPIDPGRGDGKVIVRDHRDRPVVRDHRDVPVVRDHRDSSNNSGGTKVTNTPIVRDHR